MDKVDTLPEDIVAKTLRPDRPSDFTQFLATIFDPIILDGLIDEYRIGVTRDRAVIFYQIDVQGRIRTGKVMKYDPETGHRIKDENTKGRITWVHSLLKYSGQLPQEWTLIYSRKASFGSGYMPRVRIAIISAPMSNFVNLILCEIYYHQNKHSGFLFRYPPTTLIRPLTLYNAFCFQFGDLFADATP